MENYQAEPILEPVRREKENRMGCFGFVIDTLQTILLALVLFFGINTVSARVRVENISMLPTLEPNEFVLINKMAYKLGDFSRGDIIVFHYPKNPQEDYIKRIIGVPGDEVVIKDNTVTVNGEILVEDYISAEPQYSGSWIVPEDNLFVLGDNRNQSSDSHSWGFVPVGNVVGKAVLIYWPLDNFTIFNYPNIVRAAP